MNVITIQQPWAWAICMAGKSPENRSDRRGEAVAVRTWSAAVGPVLIHTSQRDAGEEAMRVVRHFSPVDPGYPGRPGRPTEWEYGAVIAVARVAGVHAASSCYDPASGRYCTPWAEPNAAHLDLADVRKLHRPVEAKGRLGLWQITDSTVLAQIRRQAS